MTTQTLLADYLSAYNRRDLNKIISFLHPDCRVTMNGQVVLQGIEAMRPTYEQDFLNPQANAIVMEQNYEANDPNRIRVRLITQDRRLIDVTYVFESEENEGEPNTKRMVEHVIHSVKTNHDV